ncbi:Copine-1, partial [Nowakowskiella sp. JEL0078]
EKNPVIGHLNIETAILEPIPTFLDYINGGVDIDIAVSIDFTGSNGDPSDINSFHYMNPERWANDYQKAIYSIGSIIEGYDSDKQFAVFGFGAAFNTSQVSHCFALNGNEAQPYVFEVDGIFEAYGQALPLLKLAGPRMFGPTIEKISKQIRAEIDNNPTAIPRYRFLLILTNGEVSDMDRTTDAIVDASDLPLSIVIVGIGSAEFSGMEKLDADVVRIRNSKGVAAKRDIVQFVQFDKFIDPEIGELLFAAE